MNKNKENIKKKERKKHKTKVFLSSTSSSFSFLSQTYKRTHTCSTNVRLVKERKKNRHSAYLFKLINKQVL